MSAEDSFRGPQQEMLEWACDTFTIEVAMDRRERALRMIEEAIELAQACGLEIPDLGIVISRVYDRPAGEPVKEIGQAGMCLALLAELYDCDLPYEMCREFMRVQSIPKDEWARRHAAKVELGMAK